MEEPDNQVADFLNGVSLPTTADGPCPYLPDQLARSEGFYVDEPLEGAVYRALMDAGFRRSGKVFYRPRCQSCHQCIPLRVPVVSFTLTRSMRRVCKRNVDVRAEIGEPVATDEKHALFARYLEAQHDGTMSTVREGFERFLYDAPVPAAEVVYRLDKRLIGVSLVDVVPGAWSSVYMFFDPSEGRRSLGTYSVLWEIEHCRARGIAYYYLGFHVPGAKTMAYKGRFQPAEILEAPGKWTPFVEAEDV